MASLSEMIPKGVADADLVGQIRRGKQYRSVGVVGAVSSIALLVASRLIPLAGGTLGAILLTLLVASLGLIAWTRLWFRESREPFQYTYSIGGFDPVPEHGDESAPPADRDPFVWLTHDLKEKLSQRVPRLSLLEEETVPKAEPEDDPASHVHVCGWYGLRADDQGWEFEVVPEVRLGGKGAPARLATTVRLRLDSSTSVAGESTDDPPKLSRDGYGMLLERVYWSVASQIYAQIHRGVEEKVKLLPWGALRASAYVTEAEDYATSNTLDAYAAAQQLYRRALEIYDVRYREPAASPWRRRGYQALEWFSDRRRDWRRRRAGAWRRAGRRDVMTARAELGLARTLVAEWHLGQLCGMARKDIYEATEFVEQAIARLTDLPIDVGERQTALFRAHITGATIKLLLWDQPGAEGALEEAEKVLPTEARDDADYLFVAGLIEPDHLLSLRLLGQAADLAPTMERALFHKAEQYDEIWRRREPFEAEVATAVDDGYRAVIALNPGNLSAWGRRGYLGWLLAEEEMSGEKARGWREHAISALRTGRQYKEVRRDASVAELDWNLARLAAEDGDFLRAYQHYIDAVSARLADPRIDFEQKFFLSPTKELTVRFRRYQQTVMTTASEAEAEGIVPPRLIKSVKAFVLNDCGLAYQAHHERSGSERSLIRALAAFRAAERENDAFVLPRYNLAKLHLQISALPECSPEERRQELQTAIDLLRRVLDREPKWRPARLLMVELQTRLAAVAAELRESAGIESDGADGGGFEAVQPTQTAARMEELEGAAYEAAIEELRALLPHRVFRDGDEVGKGEFDRIDLSGSHVVWLLADGRVRWAREFDAFHVAALVLWAAMLATTAPVAADRLCTHLRDAYFQSDSYLLDAQRVAAIAIAADPASNPRAALRAVATREGCERLWGKVVLAELRRDPAHLWPLKQTVWLPADERRRALQAALDAEPSATALVWIGEAEEDLGYDDDAIRAYELARAGGRATIARIAALKLGRVLERRENGSGGAIEAYRAAMHSKDAAVAAEAAAQAAGLLRGTGAGEEADAVLREAATRPEVASYLAGLLEERKLFSDVVLVFRQALTIESEDGPWQAELQIRLATALLSAAGGRDGEAEALLGDLAESGLSPLNWEAKLILAQALTADEEPEARRLYEEVLGETDPTAVAWAALGLAAIMEAADEGEAAKELLLDRARLEAMRSEMARLTRERGGDADAFLAEVAAAEPAAPGNAS